MGVYSEVAMLMYLLSQQMLQAYADLAARAIRRDFLKPRIQENDFSEVKSKRDGSMIVQNTRFKTRIRHSRQVCHTWCRMKSCRCSLTISLL